MKFVFNHDFGMWKGREYSMSTIVEQTVDRVDRQGELERLRGCVDKLAEIVGVMAEFLTDEQKIKLADRFGYAPIKEYTP